MLSSAWEGDYDEVLRAAGHREATLRKWFVYADFDLTHIPDHVTIFRGGVCFKADDHYWQNSRVFMLGAFMVVGQGCGMLFRIDLATSPVRRLSVRRIDKGTSPTDFCLPSRTKRKRSGSLYARIDSPHNRRSERVRGDGRFRLATIG